MTTKIQKWGNSQGIRIPKFFLDSVNWNENTKLEVCTENNKVIITQTKKQIWHLPAQSQIQTTNFRCIFR